MVDSVHAAYSPEDTIKLNTDISYLYDSNIFRLDKNIENRQTIKNNGKSDSKLEAKVAGRLDLMMSRQMVHVVAGISQINYANFSDLNHQDWNAEVIWDWVLGHNASGQLRAGTATTMSSFDDNLLGSAGNAQLDMQKQDSINWQGVYRLQSTIDVIGAASISSEQHDVKKFIDAKTNLVRVGVRYRSLQGNSVALQHSWRKYKYDIDLPIRAGYAEQISTLDFAYIPSSKLLLNLSLGLSRWESDFNHQSKTTPQGEISAVWLLTDKTQFKASFGQTFAEFNSGVGRNLDQSFMLNAAWKMTDKINWDVNLTQRQRSIETVSSSSLNDEKRNALRVSMVYKPMPQLLFNTYVLAENKSADLKDSDYHFYQLGINASYKY